MPVFRCVVADPSGAERVLEREAPSREALARTFATGNHFLLSSEPVRGRAAGAAGRGVPAFLVREFTDMTSLLLESGMGFREALRVMGEISGSRLKALAGEFLSEIDRGDGFAQVLERRSGSFSPLYRGMVRIGERVGSLETVFPRLASYLADRKAFRDKVAGALAYPVLVLLAALAGSAGIAFFLLPRLETLFLELGGAGAREIRDRVLFAAGLFRAAAFAGLLALAAAAGAWAARRRGGPAARVLDRAILALPGVGGFVRGWETLNFAFAMEILAKGGVPLEAALREAAGTASNEAFRRAVLAAREDVLKGGALSAALARRPEIPGYVSRWAAAGERSGRTERVFSQIRRYFQAEMDRGATRFTAVLEPLLILAVGGIVLFLVAAFVLPLFSLYGSLL